MASLLATVSLLGSTEGLALSREVSSAEEFPDLRDRLSTQMTSDTSLATRAVSIEKSQVPAVAKKILTVPELEEVAFSSKSANYRDTAIVLVGFAFFAGVLSLINPLFLVAVVALLIGAALCGFESREAGLEADQAKEQLRPIYADKVREEITPPQEEEIAKLIRGESAQIVENGRFTPDQFHNMMERNAGGALKAFSSYVPGQLSYPYTVPGVETYIDESTTEPNAIFRHFAKQAVGLHIPEFMQECLSNEETFIQNRARHICGFLKLLGDGNNPVNAHISMGVFKQTKEVALDAVASKTGRLTTLCSVGQIGASPIIYRVRGDEVGLYNMEDTLKPQADRQPIARFRTSRTVTVFPPDLAGNVRYTVNRTFTRI